MLSDPQWSCQLWGEVTDQRCGTKSGGREIVTTRNLTTRMFEVEVAFDAPRPDFWQIEKQ
jgi:hypothetical protein